MRIGLTYQARLDCASTTGYPSCLIRETEGDTACKIAVTQDMSRKFQSCLNDSRESLSLKHRGIEPAPKQAGFGNIPTWAIIGGVTLVAIIVIMSSRKQQPVVVKG